MIIALQDYLKLLPNWFPSSYILFLQPILPTVVRVTISLPQRFQLIPNTLRPKPLWKASRPYLSDHQLPLWPAAYQFPPLLSSCSGHTLSLFLEHTQECSCFRVFVIVLPFARNSAHRIPSHKQISVYMSSP